MKLNMFVHKREWCLGLTHDFMDCWLNWAESSAFGSHNVCWWNRGEQEGQVVLLFLEKV